MVIRQLRERTALLEGQLAAMTVPAPICSRCQELQQAIGSHYPAAAPHESTNTRPATVSNGATVTGTSSCHGQDHGSGRSNKTRLRKPRTYGACHALPGGTDSAATSANKPGAAEERGTETGSSNSESTATASGRSEPLQGASEVTAAQVQQLVDTVLKYANVLSALQASHQQLSASHSELRHQYLSASQTVADLQNECSQLQVENTELREVSGMLSTVVAVRLLVSLLSMCELEKYFCHTSRTSHTSRAQRSERHAVDRGRGAPWSQLVPGYRFG